MPEYLVVNAGPRFQVYLVDRGLSRRHTSAACRHFTRLAYAPMIYVSRYATKKDLPKKYRGAEVTDVRGFRTLEEGEFYWVHDGKKVRRDQMDSHEALAFARKNPKARFAETNPLLHPDEWFQAYL